MSPMMPMFRRPGGLLCRAGRAPRRALILLIIAAVVLRLGFSLGVSRGLLHDLPERQSTDRYHIIAESLLAGQGYRDHADQPSTLVRPPAYPLFLLGLFRVAGIDYVVVQIAQALLGGLGVYLLYRLGRWVHSPALGLAAATLLALYPAAIEYTAHLYTETLYLPLFIGLAWALCRALDPARTAGRAALGAGLAAGLLWGAGLLTRGTLIAFPLFAVIGVPARRYLPFRPGRAWVGRRDLRWLVPAALGAALILAPWVARNWQLTRTFVPVSSWGWAPFYHGIQCSKKMLAWDDLVSVDLDAARRRHEIVVERLYGGDRSRAFAAPIDYVRHEEVARDLVLEELRADPLGAAGRALVGVPFTWFQTLGRSKRLLSLAIHLPLLALFLLGVVRMGRRAPRALARSWPALLMIVFVNLFQAFVFPHVRYMSPAIVLSFLYAGLVFLPEESVSDEA